jgi:c(7)-type cytochrome triheme protein
MKKILVLIFFAVFITTVVFAQTGVKKRRPRPDEYGRVTIGNFSEKAGLAKVNFDHWLHRAKYTCRLCHVDIGFAMTTGGTEIRAADNIQGYYCGACHNGKPGPDGKKVFESCSGDVPAEEKNRCRRCHSVGMDVTPEYDFRDYTKDFPKGRFGNGIDWEKTQADGLVKPIDYLEGISIKRDAISARDDFALSPKTEAMPDIIFSHKKHTVWNGCESCHPEIFIGVKKGITRYSMVEIFEGKYCGVCHTSVAFPLMDCQRCHSKPIQ